MTIKEKPNAQKEIAAYIDSMHPFAKAICKKLRAIILNADPSIKEEWKWGPHYSSNGMVCGYGGFQKHVKLTFFNGSAMKDSKQLFNHCVDNEFSRSVKCTDVSEIDENLLTEYVEWVTTARREETRKERIAKVVAMSKEGRTLNDKYKKVKSEK